MPLPAKPDDSKYLAGLKGKDKDMHALFEELQESKDEAKLLNLIITGQIKTSDADK